MNVSDEWLAQEQHIEWASLSFIRVIACSNVMCEALSTGTWINVLVKIISSSNLLSGEQLVTKVWSFFEVHNMKKICILNSFIL